MSGDPLAFVHFGDAALQRRQIPQAIAAYRNAVALRPDAGALHTRLSFALIQAADFKAAEAEARIAARLDPTETHGHLNLGVARHQQNRIEEAEGPYREVIRLDPNNAPALANISDVLTQLMKLDEAEACARRAMQIQPAPGYAINLASVLIHQGRDEAALEVLAPVLKAEPTAPSGQMSAALALLHMGLWFEGLTLFEARTATMRPPPEGRKTWDGSPLAGEAIVLRAEQGFGDTIQCVRYAPLLHERGAGRIVVECAPVLKDLMTTATGVDDVVSTTEGVARAPLEVYVMSLPQRFRTTPLTVPADVPYLRVDPARLHKFRSLIPVESALRVGLVWAGSPEQVDDRRRSCPLAALAPLVSVANTRFYSLQRGPAAERDAKLAAQLGIIDLGPSIEDFADLAAAMSSLDLIVTVCTAPAHLAGALGRPVWTLLPHVADWRWLRDRSDTPWYPTMRLFRQPNFNDWAGVVAQVVDALTDRVNSSQL